MANLTSVTTNFFPVASETYSGNLSATIGALAATVTATNLSAYADGDIVVLTIEPGTANEATFTGTKATNTISNVKWTEGNLGVGHNSGVTIVDYDSATHFSMVTKGIKKFANDDGTLKAPSIQAALGLGSEALNGWNALGFTPASVTNNGNRSYTAVFNGQNLTNTLSPGMRIRTQRTVAAPTQSTSLNGTTQYWSKTIPNGMTFTDNFTVSAWIKVTSYAQAAIMTRFNGTNGWVMRLNPNGQLDIYGFNSGIANFRGAISFQSVPLNKWVHVAATLGSGLSAFNLYFDGVLAPSYASSGGTLPTALIQAGNLEVGSTNLGTLFFPGKIAQAAVFSIVLGQAGIRDYMTIGLSGAETGLISAYSFNGNANDLQTANANNLTSNGSATATAADGPFGGQANGTVSSTLDHAIIQKIDFSVNTTVIVQVAEGCTVPTTGGVTAVSYSSQKSPYGFPGQRDKFTVYNYMLIQGYTTQTTSIMGAMVGTDILAPVGEWHARINGEFGASYGATTPDVRSHFGFSTTVLVIGMSTRFAIGASGTFAEITIGIQAPITVTTATTYRSYMVVLAPGVIQGGPRGVSGFITALENAYL